MLRKILTIALVLALVVVFGCKKSEPQSQTPSIPEIQKQVEKTGAEAAKEAEAVKEKAGEEVQKNTPPQ